MKLNTFYKQGAALALCLTLSFPVFAEKDLVQYVNTLQGTNSTYELSWGNTYPTTAVPYPMNSWSPQTGKNGDGWKYNTRPLRSGVSNRRINVALGWEITGYFL